jgi:agmatine deiminase
MITSLLTEKVEIRQSKKHNKGLFAKFPIYKDEIVFIKGGHILRKEDIFSSSVINSYQPISDDYFIGALNKYEEEGIKIYVNHSCNPNCGLRGEITFVAIRDIVVDEELTTDYAFIDNEEYSFVCTCGYKECRKIVTGYDWKLKSIQEKYLDYFSEYLKRKVILLEKRKPVMVENDIRVPASFNFYMPAEFAEHRSTWMLWPERNDIWRMGAKPAQAIFETIASAISSYEPVVVGVTQAQYENAFNRLSGNIRVIEISYDDAWIRDNGATFLKNSEGQLCGIDWFFNAWGGIGQISKEGKWELPGSYFPWKLDDLVARKMLAIEAVKRFRCPLILEGGAIHTDGNGTLLAIKKCVLGRNPNKSQTDVEQILYDYLGVNNIIWLEKGLYLEENDGHIDNMCCFANPHTILLNWSEDTSDPQYKISCEAYDILVSAKNAHGEPYNIVKIPQPPAMYITEEEHMGVDSSEYAIPRLPNDRLPASYINSYICNGAVIIPSFNSDFDNSLSDYDKNAYNIYREVFLDREIIQIPARELLLGGGGIHCILQQIPKA